MEKKSMSVMEMGKLLGIKKTESYWLVHKNLFEVKTVGKQMRVMIESFEYWYARQFHYKKITGEAPGTVWSETTFSVSEIANLFGISRGSAHCLTTRKHFQSVKVTTIDNQLRIDKNSFYQWLNTQPYYKLKKKEDNDV